MTGSFTADEEIFRNDTTGFITGVGGETTEAFAGPYQFHISVIGIYLLEMKSAHQNLKFDIHIDLFRRPYITRPRTVVHPSAYGQTDVYGRSEVRTANMSIYISKNWNFFKEYHWLYQLPVFLHVLYKFPILRINY